MSAVDEIFLIEHSINDSLKRQDFIKIKLGQCDMAIKRAASVVGIAQAKISLHENNRKHMRTVAGIVDIKEWTQNQNHLDAAKASLEEGKAALGIAESAKESILAETAAIDKHIGALRTELGTFGEIRIFPVKS